jgi:hypothetical protein
MLGFNDIDTGNLSLLSCNELQNYKKASIFTFYVVQKIQSILWEMLYNCSPSAIYGNMESETFHKVGIHMYINFLIEFPFVLLLVYEKLKIKSFLFSNLEF